MDTPTNTAARWSTASFGAPTDTSPMELSALGKHLDLCQGARGRLFALRCIADRLGSFVASRFVTTWGLLLALAAGLAAWLL